MLNTFKIAEQENRPTPKVLVQQATAAPLNLCLAQEPANVRAI
jgi:hypothetical protein